MTEDEFVELFRGKLGSPAVCQKMFRLFDTQNTRRLDPKDFCAGLAIIELGTNEQKLKFFFQLYDQDDSGRLEGNELQNVLDQIQTLSIMEGRDPAHAARIIQNMKRSFETTDVVLTKWKEIGEQVRL